MAEESAPQGAAHRLTGVDFLRGLVIVLMSLDHSRNFWGGDAGNAGDLADPRNSLQFGLTRWVTHFCAPTFIFLAGTSAWLWASRGRTKNQLSWYLFSRGLMLVFFELTLVRVGWGGDPMGTSFGCQVMYAIGTSMMLMSLLSRLPPTLLLLVGLLIVGAHNLTDEISAEDVHRQTAAALEKVGAPESIRNPVATVADDIWKALHAGGPIVFHPGKPREGDDGRNGPPDGAVVAFIAYPALPWTGVMALGFCLGPLLKRDERTRRSWLFWLGLGLTLAFLALRGLHELPATAGASGAIQPTERGKTPAELTYFQKHFGDSWHWSKQNDWQHTLLSFLNCTKYPPSLYYALMTLGPALLLLSLIGDPTGPFARFFIVFGRVPLFFYLVHAPVYCFSSRLAEHVTRLLENKGTIPAGSWPWGTGYLKSHELQSLWGLSARDFDLLRIYGIFVLVTLLLYPVCKWYGGLRHRKPRPAG